MSTIKTTEIDSTEEILDTTYQLARAVQLNLHTCLYINILFT